MRRHSGNRSDDLGEGLAPGANHYRAYVGPPEDYDLIGALSFGLLAKLGLRQHHSVLDIGCGSLRVGRLLIPYLNSGGYTGFEPNRWLVEEGIARECGRDQIDLKRPRFVFDDDPNAIAAESGFDFALAQSIFSHSGPDLLETWLRVSARCLRPTGVLAATFLEGEVDHERPGWVYPDCVGYRGETMERLARECGLGFRRLGWTHPRQTWALLFREDFPLESIEDGLLSDLDGSGS